MKIVSNFRDYYDHQAHLYGGGDPKVTYERLAFDRHSNNQLAAFTVDTAYDVPRVPEFYAHRNEYQFKWLVVMARKFLLVQTRGVGDTPPGSWRVVNAKEHPLLAQRTEPERRRKRFLWENNSAGDYMGRYVVDSLLTLSKDLRAPVFSYSSMGYHRILVDRNIPILGDLGLAAVYEPQQLYQDLAYFMGNTLRGSPDLAPPSTMTNKERIVQHGFDLKQSFRHRR